MGYLWEVFFIHSFNKYLFSIIMYLRIGNKEKNKTGQITAIM